MGAIELVSGIKTGKGASGQGKLDRRRFGNGDENVLCSTTLLDVCMQIKERVRYAVQEPNESSPAVVRDNNN